MAEFIPAEHIEEAAAAFLRAHHPALSLPIPIEEILEIGLRVEIIPVKGMLSEHSIDGFLSKDLSSIYIDHDEYMDTSGNYRGRFTLAHEAGHLAMHSEYISSLEIENVERWKQIILDGSKGHERMETQARMFAKYALMPTEHVERVFEENKRILLANIADNPLPSDLNLAPYAAKELGRACQVSAESATWRLTEWIKSGH